MPPPPGPPLAVDAFVGRRHSVERALVCAMQGQFPVLARSAAGELAIAFRTGAAHYGLAGTLATACSEDGGRTWSDPIEVAPRGDDVRNPALGVLDDGRWVLLYWRAGVHAYPAGDGGARRWRTPSADAGSDARAPDLFAVTSADRGRTWSAPRPVVSARLAWASPYGRIVAGPDGALLAPAYGPRRRETGDASSGGAAAGAFDAIALRSRDGGATWGDESLVAAGGSELALCALDGRRLAGAVRLSDGRTAVVRSDDGGRAWTAPVAVTRAGEHPADLCRLRGSGALLLTFGRRRRPLGCGALASADGGLTWDADREVLLAGDGIGNDVGYPSTVQLDDGTLVTALYFARGSAASEAADGWGETSCQVLRYPEALVAPG